MRMIDKREEPEELTIWRKRNPDKHKYEELSAVERTAIRTLCLEDQKGLCAFCCGRISVDTSHNAHLLCRAHHPQYSLKHGNIVASCEANEHCGRFQKKEELPLTPLMPGCETELKFYITGRVEGTSQRAQQTIEVLNLNDAGLRQRRRKAIRDLELEPAFYPVEDIKTWDEELLKNIIEEYSREREGKLVIYAPVLINIFKQYLTYPSESPHAHTS